MIAAQSRNGTPAKASQSCTESHTRALTPQKLAAAELVAAGKTDVAIAADLGLNRTSVMRWRNYDPVFQAAVNACRAEVWAASIDRLRALAGKAVETLEATLNDTTNPNRWRAAIAILQVIKPPAEAFPATGPTDPDEIVMAEVARQRAAELAQYRALHEVPMRGNSLPITVQVAKVRSELTQAAESSDA